MLLLIGKQTLRITCTIQSGSTLFPNRVYKLSNIQTIIRLHKSSPIMQQNFADTAYNICRKMIQRTQMTMPSMAHQNTVLVFIWIHSNVFLTKTQFFFLFLHKNISCGYSLEVPHWGTSKEYPQHMFLWWNKKNIYLLVATPLIKSYDYPLRINFIYFFFVYFQASKTKFGHAKQTVFLENNNKSQKGFPERKQICSVYHFPAVRLK